MYGHVHNRHELYCMLLFRGFQEFRFFKRHRSATAIISSLPVLLGHPDRNNINSMTPKSMIKQMTRTLYLNIITFVC